MRPRLYYGVPGGRRFTLSTLNMETPHAGDGVGVAPFMQLLIRAVFSMNNPGLFEPVEPPFDQRRRAISGRARWLTWSGEFRRFLREWATYSRTVPRPELRLVGRRRPYGETYSLPMSTDRDGVMATHLRRYSKALLDQVTPGALLFFDRLMDRSLGRRAVHTLFAAMRDMLAELHQDQQSALYNPLGSFGKNERDFPLHADLYAPRYLLNIFDDVPGDGSGASLFLPIEELEGVLGRVESMPPAERRRILACLRVVVTGDRYDRLYDLLYGAGRPWRSELRKELRRAQYVMPFERGQGYLIDDREWLHGRRAPTGGVTQNRIHRLIFDSHASAAARHRALNGRRA